MWGKKRVGTVQDIVYCHAFSDLPLHDLFGGRWVTIAVSSVKQDHSWPTLRNDDDLVASGILHEKRSLNSEILSPSLPVSIHFHKVDCGGSPEISGGFCLFPPTDGDEYYTGRIDLYYKNDDLVPQFLNAFSNAAATGLRYFHASLKVADATQLLTYDQVKLLRDGAELPNLHFDRIGFSNKAVTSAPLYTYIWNWDDAMHSPARSEKVAKWRKWRAKSRA